MRKSQKCVCIVLQADLASREGTGDPQQVQSLEGHQNEADVGCQVLGTFWVHEMVGGVAAHVRFKAHSGCQVNSAKRPYKHRSEAVLTQTHTCKTRHFHWHRHSIHQPYSITIIQGCLQMKKQTLSELWFMSDQNNRNGKYVDRRHDPIHL